MSRPLTPQQIPDGDKSPSTAGPTEPQPVSRRQRVLVAAFCGMLFFAVYVLSAGPVVWISRKLMFPPLNKSLAIIYAPLVALAKHDGNPLSRLLAWYIGLFR